MPVLYIITGSNGAGKSSVGPEYVPQHLSASIFDGDKLFMQKQRDYYESGVKSYKECKKLAFEFVGETFEQLVENALQGSTDFAYEGHFTNDATWDIPRRFKDAGFEIHLIFFGLTDTSSSEMRVVARSKEGGHYVDPRTLADNFYGNLQKMDVYWTMFDSVMIVDTSSTEHIVLATLMNGTKHESLAIVELPDWFTVNLPAITAAVTLEAL